MASKSANAGLQGRAKARYFLQCFPKQYIQCASQHLHGDQWYERAHGVDTARECASSSASQIAQLSRPPPFSGRLPETEVLEDVDKVGVVELPPEHCKAPLHYPSLRFFKSRGIQMCRAETFEQRQPLVLVESDSKGNVLPFASSLHVSHC